MDGFFLRFDCENCILMSFTAVRKCVKRLRTSDSNWNSGASQIDFVPGFFSATRAFYLMLVEHLQACCSLSLSQRSDCFRVAWCVHEVGFRRHNVVKFPLATWTNQVGCRHSQTISWVINRIFILTVEIGFSPKKKYDNHRRLWHWQ